METLWLKFAEQAPNLGVLTFLVIYFLRHIQESAEASRHAESEKTKRLSEVIERNSAALDRSSEALGRSVYVIDRQHGNGKAN